MIFFFGLALLICNGCGSKKEDRKERTGVNRPPIITKVVLTPLSPVAGQALKAQVEAVDPDGDEVYLSYKWEVNGIEVPSEDQDEFSSELLKPGDKVVVVVAAHDGKTWGNELASGPVTIVSAPLTGFSVEISPEIVFPGDVIKASISGASSDFREMRPLFRWKVNEEIKLEGPDDEFSTRGLKRGDRIQVEVILRQGHEVRERGISKPLIVQNRPPQIISQPPQRLAQPGLYRYRVRAKDPDGDALTFSLEGEVPAGMHIDPRSGILEWNFSRIPTTTVKVDIRVTDGHGGEARQSYELSISEGRGS